MVETRSGDPASSLSSILRKTAPGEREVSYDNSISSSIACMYCAETAQRIAR